MTADASALTLPRDVRLADGSAITLRLLARTDREPFLRFTQSLPEHDLLFLRIDISDPDVIDAWLDNIDLERIVTIVAERDGRIWGYGSLHMSNAHWSRHVGEIRVLIDGALRGKGLGRALAEAIFAQALEHGIEKIIAQMTIDQEGAIATFEQLGFKAEALLRDHVKDRTGRTHDLLLYSHDVRSFQSQLDAYGVTEAAAGQ
ncbi:MAG TPA: GNAT family N-acetyltransferase [Dehalococcoidia bacterium]|jgi:RimJ/RimL family protein N-acetyltransferase|nr:GNAT family N-acetyltransferase [Dehalococcoidia bacterium]